MTANVSKEKHLLSDVFKSKKLIGRKRLSKCESRQVVKADGQMDCSVLGLVSPTPKHKLTKVKEYQPSNGLTAHQQEFEPKRANATTPVAPGRVKKRTDLMGIQNANRPHLRVRTPGKLQVLDEEFQSSTSSSSSQRFSGSPICSSSPGRNWQSSQDSGQEVIWNCASPIAHYHRTSRDASNIKELCRQWENAQEECNRKENKMNSLLDLWGKHTSVCLPETRSKLENTQKTNDSASKEPLVKLREEPNSGNERRLHVLSPLAKFTRTPERMTSPNSSTDELWGDEDESFMITLSQISPELSQELFPEETQCLDNSQPATPLKADYNVIPKEHRTPVGSDSDLWDDDPEVFSQEVLTLIEQQITATSRCSAEEIARKRQEALSKRTQNKCVWNRRLRETR